MIKLTDNESISQFTDHLGAPAMDHYILIVSNDTVFN